MADAATRTTTTLGVRPGPTRSEVVRLALARLSEQRLPERLDAAARRAARRMD